VADDLAEGALAERAERPRVAEQPRAAEGGLRRGDAAREHGDAGAAARDLPGVLDPEGGHHAGLVGGDVVDAE
jgi:hypothetical protein